MKEKIHPKYYSEAKVSCACGNTFITGSTRPTLRVEVCSKCHPFYTGEKRIMDTGGTIERFRRRLKLADSVTGKGPSKRKTRDTTDTTP